MSDEPSKLTWIPKNKKPGPDPFDEYLEYGPPGEFWFKVMGFCGCGLPEETRDWLIELLELLRGEKDENGSFCRVDDWYEKQKALLGDRENGMAGDFVLYVLDAIGWTEHGGSVYGSRLSEAGIDALDKLKADKAKEASDG